MVEVLKYKLTAATETVLAPISALTGAVGKGALESLLGRRVTERGMKEGFKRFLDPKFYQDRIPQKIVEKTSKFFTKLNNVTGSQVEKAVRSKAATGMKIKFEPIQQQAKQLLEETGAKSIEDLGSPTISAAQRNKLGEFMKIVDRVKQKELSPLTVFLLQ